MNITQQTQKKKDVEPAGNSEKPLDITSPEFDMNAAVEAVQAPPSPEVGQTDPAASDEQEIEKLRALYKEKFGKDADSRWKISRLTKEING